MAFEEIVNKIYAICHNELCDKSRIAVEYMKDKRDDFQGVEAWPSFATSMSIIANRVTPLHRDRSGKPSFQDILFSLGRHTDAWLTVLDLGARFRYLPGTAVVLCGRVLKHAVTSWEGGDRVCYAHYTREEALSHLGIKRPDFASVETHLRHFHGRTGVFLRDAFLNTIPTAEEVALHNV